MSGKIRNLKVIKTSPFAPGPVEDVILQGAGSLGGAQPPVIVGIDGATGTVYFENPSGLQIEIYKYTRRHRSTQSGTAYSMRLGKRFKPLRLLANGQLTWVVESRWIKPTLTTSIKQKNRRNYFRFGVRDPNTGARSSLTSSVVATVVNFEFIAAGALNPIRIMLQPHIAAIS